MDYPNGDSPFDSPSTHYRTAKILVLYPMFFVLRIKRLESLGMDAQRGSEEVETRY
ncbi:uncharacterized protein BO88DRAFT_406164 [Aspergillus vadensis CBS 113365]|uniref:Uncharacterized protein n=1 Tax=Aspergillus vadensis (strain CBS 113365 / IMI 142717 / IBT 24658) TaxID=1448311 RepID=A0A319B9W9_ASPVC|nr:hypothetical protein BO88DRAFT_406164 [Aspergillus vadensis CBS 113365]PYH67270.1 hypothetical protein BO88DRAFT_406164 [Aspergillus vadensis CBS 113365]